MRRSSVLAQGWLREELASVLRNIDQKAYLSQEQKRFFNQVAAEIQGSEKLKLPVEAYGPFRRAG
jgi:hypothetical protein